MTAEAISLGIQDIDLIHPRHGNLIHLPRETIQVWVSPAPNGSRQVPLMPAAVIDEGEYILLLTEQEADFGVEHAGQFLSLIHI